MGIFDLIGLAGAAIFIGSYLLLALGRLTSGAPLYYALNVLGIGMALSSHLHDLNIASAIIQAFVFLISLIGLARWRINRGISLRQSDDRMDSAERDGRLSGVGMAEKLPQTRARRLAAE